MSFIDQEYDTSAVVENGHTNYQLGLTQRDGLGVTQPNDRQPFPATLIGNERLTAANHWQDVRLLTFDIAQSPIT